MNLSKILYRMVLVFSGLIAIAATSSAQNTTAGSVEDLKAATWKIDQLYLDTNRVFDATMDSLRYSFGENGSLMVSAGENFASAQFDYDASAGQLTIEYEEDMVETYNVVYLSPFSLIYWINKQNSLGTVSRLEFRMVPE